MWKRTNATWNWATIRFSSLRLSPITATVESLSGVLGSSASDWSRNRSPSPSLIGGIRSLKVSLTFVTFDSLSRTSLYMSAAWVGEPPGRVGPSPYSESRLSAGCRPLRRCVVTNDGDNGPRSGWVMSETLLLLSVFSVMSWSMNWPQ